MARVLLAVIFMFAVFSDIASAAPAPAKQPDQQQFVPKRVEVDTNYDGKIDRTEIYDASGQISKVEISSKGDGVVDEWITYKNGVPVKKEKDTNGDGKPDVWITY